MPKEKKHMAEKNKKIPYSRYYRHLLNTSEQKVYDAISDGISDKKHEIEVPLTPSIELEKIWHAVNLDNPQFYNVDFSKLMIQSGLLRCVLFVDYYWEGDALTETDERIKKAVKPVAAEAQGKSQEEIALYLHDRLVRRCSYDTLPEKPQNAHNIVGPLLDNTCVCEGYAKAYKYLADLLRLRCAVVCGDGLHPDGSSGRHAWNLIKIGDNSFHIDVTFDHLIGGRYCSHAYYNLSTKEITYDHRIDPGFDMIECKISGSILPRVTGTQELIEFMKKESLRGASFSEVRLTKGFSRDKLFTMISDKLTAADIIWYSRVDSFWYREKSKTLCITWK